MIPPSPLMRGELYILCEYGRLHLFFSGCSFFAIIAISTKIGILSGIFNHHRIGSDRLGERGATFCVFACTYISWVILRGKEMERARGGSFVFFAQRYQKLEFLMTRFLWTCGGGELNSPRVEDKGGS